MLLLWLPKKLVPRWRVVILAHELVIFTSDTGDHKDLTFFSFQRKMRIFRNFKNGGFLAFEHDDNHQKECRQLRFNKVIKCIEKHQEFWIASHIGKNMRDDRPKTWNFVKNLLDRATIYLSSFSCQTLHFHNYPSRHVLERQYIDLFNEI